RLLAVSALLPVKNIGLILEALKQLLSTVTLEIVGDGPLRPILETQARELGIAQRVVFHGWIPHQALPKIYACADIFVHTSWHEGEGFVIEEALASGLPVVSSKVGIALDVVMPGKNGFLFAPGDIDEFVAALEHLKDRPDECQRFGAVSRAIAEEKLDRSKQVEKLIRLYKRTIVGKYDYILQS
ncbi:MAG: glycosyltransferase, partial [bacterium]